MDATSDSESDDSNNDNIPDEDRAVTTTTERPTTASSPGTKANTATPSSCTKTPAKSDGGIHVVRATSSSKRLVVTNSPDPVAAAGIEAAVAAAASGVDGRSDAGVDAAVGGVGADVGGEDCSVAGSSASGAGEDVGCASQSISEIYVVVYRNGIRKRVRSDGTWSPA